MKRKIISEQELSKKKIKQNLKAKKLCKHSNKEDFWNDSVSPYDNLVSLVKRRTDSYVASIQQEGFIKLTDVEREHMRVCFFAGFLAQVIAYDREFVDYVIKKGHASYDLFILVMDCLGSNFEFQSYEIE